MATGITKRHSEGCASREGERCNCNAGWQASVFSRREGQIRRTFAREAEARSWRRDALTALSKGTFRAPAPTTVREAWDEWYEGAKAGTIRNRSGDPFKLSALRAYSSAMRLRILDEFGEIRLDELRRSDLQDFADRMLAEDLSPSYIQTTLLPLRAIYRCALARDQLAANPCAGLQVPAVRSRRNRYASPEEAEMLIEAVPLEDKAVWAVAMYGGLRLGELRALRVEAIDLAAGVIRVEYGWDPAEGQIELKSQAGRRKVPIAAVLRDYLTEHLARTGRRGSDLIFGRTPELPFVANRIQERADEAWRDAGLERLTPHACRHSYASFMIASGVNAKALQTFMGHSSVTVTNDRHGHLMPGSEEEAAGMLDAYLTAQREGAEEAARMAGAELTSTPTSTRATFSD